MRLAIPLFGSDVAPRFCAADRLLVVDAVGGQIGGRLVMPLGDPAVPERLSLLRREGVQRLLCGGFNRRYLPMAHGTGITVFWGYAGDAEAALRSHLAGDPPPYECPCRGDAGHRRRRRRDTWR